MMMRFRVSALLFVSLVLQVVAAGQGGDRRRGGGENMPKVGSLLPEISVFDARGDSFPLREKLKGRHAVIVFGCLT
jgi:hypothetical protein